MSETAATHDGWKSRKAQVGLGSLVTGVAVATAALFVGRASFAEWAGFVQLYVPALFGLFATGEVVQKIGLSRAK